MNTFGEMLRLTTFGESHGRAIGGVIDGFPAGMVIDMPLLLRLMARRQPGQSSLTTARREADEPEILSGVLDGVTLGTPIGFIIPNGDVRSSDYDTDLLRPGHADYTYLKKYGVADLRGGGRASARETACRVFAGALAGQYLLSKGIEVSAYTSALGGISMAGNRDFYAEELVDANPVRCPDGECAAAMQCAIEKAARMKDSLGGVVTCVVRGVPAGVGEPVYGKLSARLASAMMSINAAHGFEYGMGFDGASRRGSEVMDTLPPGEPNHAGGILGGISTGADITMRIAFKPVATMPGRTVDTIDREGHPATITYRGRHDVCVVPRAVPVVQAMAALTILDSLLISRLF